jgi:FKBP-type peptidyl-prolyl cis-trans isomerase
MHERWIQCAATVVCGLAISAAPATAPTTKPATKPAMPMIPAPATRPVVTTRPVPAPAPEKHEPVGLPPLPTVPAAPVAVTHPVTQPAGQPVVPPIAQPVPPPAPVVRATTQPGPIDDKVMYLFGYAAGKRLHDQLEADGRAGDNLADFKGYIDGLSGHDPAYSRQDMEAAFADYLAYTQQRRAEKLYADNPSFRKRADENLQKSRALLDQNAEMAQVDTRPDGVQMQETNAGTGRVVGNAKTLTVKNLRVSLADGTLVKSTDGDQTEKIATADLLPALIDAVHGMRVGTKCRIWLPPDKAYGLTGKPPVIGPNQAVEYEFELVNAE